MTAPPDVRDFLNDMVNACRSLLQFTDRMTLEEYLADEKTRYTVMRAYEILGEAVRHIPEPPKSDNPHIPWAPMAAVRNRIVHGYRGSDDSILFVTINEDVRPLLPALQALAYSRGVRR